MGPQSYTIGKAISPFLLDRVTNDVDDTPPIAIFLNKAEMSHLFFS